MFVLAGTAQINMDNVEEFDLVANSNISYQLQVRFVSGTTQTLCEGTAEQCSQYLATIMTSYNLQKQKPQNS